VTENDGRSRSYLIFDSILMAVAAAILIVVVPHWWSAGHPLGLAVLIIPVIVLVAAFPLVLMRPRGDITIGFDSAALTLLVLLVPGHQAMVLWTLGTIVSQATGRKALWVRFFNIALLVVNGQVMLSLMHWIAPLDRTSPRELLSVVVGAAVYFTLDLVLTGASVALESRQSLWQTIRDHNIWLPLACFIGINSLGYLAVILRREVASWSLLLLAVPVLTMLVAARAVAQAQEHGLRLAGLLSAATAAQQADDPERIFQILRAEAQRMLRVPVVEQRDDPPIAHELGVRLPTPDGSGEGQWLVAGRRNSRDYGQPDRQALDALVALAVESLSRLALSRDMSYLARCDPLTGLANRTVFLERVEQALASHRRHGRPVAVLFCDLDGFKTANDRFGHVAGDQVLNETASRLARCVRPNDTVARLGGDEFAVLLEDVGSDEDARAVADRILAATKAPYDIAGRQVRVGVSIGYAMGTAEEDASALLRNADLAMYQAKSSGKNRSEQFRAELHVQNLARLDLVDDLRQALDDETLSVHYQPVVDLGTGRIEGVEALLRWQHPTLGSVPPPTFVRAAEEAGLIGRLGHFVLDSAYSDACELSAKLGRPLTLGVNLSGQQLRDRAILDQVHGLQRDAMSPRLILEITESVLVDDEGQPLEILHSLRELGVSLAIDDFGTGYSSIGYLRRLPVDVLKIDRSFLEGIDTDSKAGALVEAILGIGRTLNLRVVAEGIEHPGQLAALRRIGCELGQGYLLSRPVPYQQLEAVLAFGALPIAPAPRGPLADQELAAS
jgi:diguanylate cyclase (GGDEF)-like protein